MGFIYYYFLIIAHISHCTDADYYTLCIQRFFSYTHKYVFTYSYSNAIENDFSFVNRGPRVIIYSIQYTENKYH